MLCVQNEYANLRKGPGLKYELSWKVYRYMPLEKISKKEGWYQVKDMDGKQHWIREDLVTTAFQCGAVNADNVKLHSGPGKDYPKVAGGSAARYLSFRVLQQEGNWTQLEDVVGDESWIHRQFLWMP